MKIEELLDKPYWIADILPEQVPANSAGQYFAIEEYYLQEPRVSALRRNIANIILKLNCYYDISVIEDPDDDLEKEAEKAGINPAPEEIAELFTGKYAANCVQILVMGENALIVSNRDETYLTIYNPSERMVDMIRRLASAEGMFVWRPRQ